MTRLRAEDLDMDLDSGIRPYVDVLCDADVITFESCEGGQGHAFYEPTIRFFGDEKEAFRALGIALRAGLPVSRLRHVYVIQDGELESVGPTWELVFSRKAA